LDFVYARGVYSSSGSVDEIAIYSVYGKQTISTGSKVTPFGFQGSYTDSTALLYLINRYYDPATGQFVSVDPMVNETNQPYAYAGDDPVNGVDPSGLLPFGLSDEGSLSIDEILQNPQLVKDLNPEEVLTQIGGVPDGWQVSPANGQTVPGWKIFQLKPSGVRIGNQIRWNITNSDDHPDQPQWTVTNSGTKTRVPGGEWANGPEEYVGNSNEPDVGPCDASMNSSLGNVILAGCGIPDGGFGEDPFGDDEVIPTAFDGFNPCVYVRQETTV
jgi:RHS repeat-associated protein